MIGSRLGPYHIEAVLGSGGMGQVFRATDTRLGRNVAVKVSEEKFTDRFEREARAIAVLNHPHVCTLYDVGPNYLVMELVEGETLAARLKRGKLSMEETIQYGAQIASALVAAHAKGVTHRDLKPGNIMLTRSGVKVLDFGLAKSEHDETLTVANVVVGTPAYMAPEQREGKLCDARTDIYALGLVLLEMATGKRTLSGEKLQLDSLPHRFAHVVERCLAPAPEDRWQSARDAQSELEWAAREEPVSPVADLPRRTSGFWPIVAILAMLGLAALAFLYFRKPVTEAPVVYTAVLPPANTSFNFTANYGPMSLSPDGRSMVFAATGAEGKSQLYLRRLDAAVAQALDGTENGVFPFWSPDSRWVAFFAGGMLKKINIQGGQPVPLAKGDGMGGSWSPKGMIVFAPETFAPLLKISADGEGVTPAVDPDVAMGTAHGFPWFLPDGEHFLFASWGGAGHMNLRVGSLSSTATTLVCETDSNAAYADGRLLYLRGNSLVARPFDLKTLRASGESVPVAGRVTRFLTPVAAAAFSVSNTGLLAYQSGADAVQQLTWLDRAGKPVGTVGEPRVYFDIEFSPDRRSLTASTPDAAGNYDLWMFDMARGLPSRFTFDPAGEYYGIWSADGRSIIFNSTRKGHYDLYRKSALGGGSEELLYADDTDKVPTSWSHDGQFLLYFTGGGGRFKTFVLSLKPERPGGPMKSTPLDETSFDELFPQFSPDDRWIAYQSDESGQSEIYVAPFSRLAEKHQISPGGGQLPRWNSDGKKIVYVNNGGQLMEAEVRISGETMEVGTVRKAFAEVPGLGGYPWDLSADGERVLAAMPVAKPSEPVTLIQNWIARLRK